MRIAAAALAASLALAALPPAWAAGEPPQLPDPSAPAAPAAALSRAEQLDSLFTELKAAPDAITAKLAEDAIMALWLQSGSDTVDLLMSWGVKAIAAKDYPQALDILDRVVTLKPDYAEGWNKRATVYYLTDQYGRSISDIEHVLVLEPRHFGALVGLGSIFRDLGEDQRAIEAFKQALALDPHLANAQKALDRLEKQTEQRI